MKPRIRKLLYIAMVVLFLFSTGKVIVQWLSEDEGNDSYAKAEAIALATTPATETSAPSVETEAPTEVAEPPVEEVPEETTAPTEPEIIWIPAPLEEEDPEIDKLASIDLNALREVNPDVIGWIRIPNSKINYPLMQGEDNTFYLEHTWEGNKNPYGSIFLESRNSPDMTDFNTIIYGHNMLNGSMFGGLSSFGYQWYFNWNKYVYILTDAGIFRYEIFSSYAAEVDSATYGLSFYQWETRENFISMALENSQIKSDVVPEPTDRIITLSTCTGVGYESRRVVHAVLKMIPSE